MFKNYFVTAWRNLLNNKFYSTINVIGLAVGLAVGIMILLWVQDELSYDNFHARAQRIFKVNSHMPTGESEQVWEGSPSPLAVHAPEKIPEVEAAVRIRDDYENSLFTYEGKSFIGAGSSAPALAYVDPDFFTVFDFKLLKGSRSVPFDGSHSVILTASVAEKIFGNEDPIGKILVADKQDNFKVTGVIEDFPLNSSIRYDMLFPMELYAGRFTGNGSWKTIDEDLGNYTYKIFLLLKPGASSQVAEKKVSDMYRSWREEQDIQGYFTLQRLTHLHLYGADGNSSAMQTVRIFIVVSIFILLIACINYVNLSTARSIVRSKEVSVRKVIGANRGHLFLQFLLESAILFFISAILAIGIIRLLLPLYNEVSGKRLVLAFGDVNMWFVLGCAIVGSLAAASIYPAILLSSFKPIDALKGKAASGVGSVNFRKVLVVTQFVFSVALIISTIVISLQLQYTRERDLGYDKEHVFSFNMRNEMMSHSQAVRNELMKVRGIVDVSFSNGNIVGSDNTTGDTDWDGKDPHRSFLIHGTGIDEHFIPLFHIKMALGNNFTGSRSDSAHIILNETAVKEAGIKDPIGKRFQLWQINATIIGVIKDFNYASLKQRIEPAAFYYSTSYSWKAFIKTNGKDASKAIAAAQRAWMQYNPDYPFSYSFVDEDYDQLYKADQRTGVLFNVFAAVAIVISCLGLFGLATYTAYARRKEIGIRKVLGAGVTQITALLAKDFVLLVVFSLFIAVPLAWWAMSQWLQDFVYRINLGWGVFAVSGALAVIIALLTVCFQAVKAATANPVVSLKEE
jgi:putative ABC transport system permease protein